MATNVRTFLREFAAFKAKARRGGTVQIRDQEGEFIFAAGGARRTLLGSARGKIRSEDNIAGPTLGVGDCKPSL